MKQDNISKILEGGLSMLIANYILDSTNSSIEDDGENHILYLETPYIFTDGGELFLVEAIYLSDDMEISIRLDPIGTEEIGNTFVSPSLSFLQFLYQFLGLDNDDVNDFLRSIAKAGA